MGSGPATFVAGVAATAVEIRSSSSNISRNSRRRFRFTGDWVVAAATE